MSSSSTEALMRTALADRAELIHPYGDTVSAVLARHRRSRRRRTVAVALSLTAAVGAGAALVPGLVRDDTAAVVTPATQPSTPLDEVYGVTVTWLPEGMTPVGYALNEEESSRLAIMGLYLGSPTGQLVGGGDDPGFAISVSRGDVAPDRAVDDMSPVHGSPELPAVETTLDIGGQRAVLTYYEPGADGRSSLATLIWDATDTVRLDVMGQLVPPDDLRKIAEGLVVGSPQPGPTDPVTAEAAVQAVVRQALTRSSVDGMVAAVVDGESLRQAIEARIAAEAAAGLSLGVPEVAPVVFLNETRAVAMFQQTVDAGGWGSNIGSADLTLTADGWKYVTYSYCGFLTSPPQSVTCP